MSASLASERHLVLAFGFGRVFDGVAWQVFYVTTGKRHVFDQNLTPLGAWIAADIRARMVLAASHFFGAFRKAANRHVKVISMALTDACVAARQSVVAL